MPFDRIHRRTVQTYFVYFSFLIGKWRFVETNNNNNNLIKFLSELEFTFDHFLTIILTLKKKKRRHVRYLKKFNIFILPLKLPSHYLFHLYVWQSERCLNSSCFYKDLSLLEFTHISVLVWMYAVYANPCGGHKRMSATPEVGVTGGCEPPDVSAGTWTWALCKSRKHS